MARDYSFLLFKSVSHALSAEIILKRHEIPFKLIPVPKQISSDCGVCIRFSPIDNERIMGALSCAVDIDRVVSAGCDTIFS